MGLFNGMKDKLGFNGKPEWQDDDYAPAGGYEEGYEGEDEVYDEGREQPGSGSVVSFDAYNPAKFENVTFSSDKPPRVATYDSLDSTPAAGSRSSRSSYSSRSGGSSASRSSSARAASGTAAAGEGWSRPDDPSFLDNAGPAYTPREVHEELSAAAAAATTRASSVSAGEPLSSLGSDFMNLRGDPATHLAIVRPTAYADVEKVANAAKAGKSIVLDVTETRNELAKRILDFTFGAASALNLNVDKAAERIFVISKGSEMLSKAERDYLREQGILK